jgi:hypothetical protein
MGFRLLPTSVASTYTTVGVLVASLVNILVGPMTDFTPHRRRWAIAWNHLSMLCSCPPAHHYYSYHLTLIE